MGRARSPEFGEWAESTGLFRRARSGATSVLRGTSGFPHNLHCCPPVLAQLLLPFCSLTDISRPFVAKTSRTAFSATFYTPSNTISFHTSNYGGSRKRLTDAEGDNECSTDGSGDHLIKVQRIKNYEIGISIRQRWFLRRNEMKPMICLQRLMNVLRSVWQSLEVWKSTAQ
jgi:hypothetical protein